MAPAGEQSGAARGLSTPRGVWVHCLVALQITSPPHSGLPGRPSGKCFAHNAAGVVERADCNFAAGSVTLAPMQPRRFDIVFSHVVSGD